MTVALSVIIPVYNVEKYLDDCITSVVNQSLRNIEIICIDDGSTDSSGKILDEYSERDNRIKVIHRKNGGVGSAMNEGIRISTGEYIGIVESDDFADASMFESLYRIAKTNELDYVKSDFWMVNDQGRTKRNVFLNTNIGCNTIFSANENMNKLKNAKAIWSAIYKRDFIISNDICFLETRGASFQDTSFWFKVAITANKAMMIDEAFLNYRINENSSVKSKEKVFCVCDEVEECLRYIQDKGLTIFMPFFWRYKFDSYFWNLNRLEGDAQILFLRRFCDEFLTFPFDDYEVMKQFTNDDVDYIRLLINSFESVKNAYEICADGRQFEVGKQAYDQIYIYGAGKKGKLLRAELSKIYPDCNIGFVVSDENHVIDEGVTLESNTLDISTPIVIAIANPYIKMIMTSRAVKRGFRDIFFFA